LDFKPIDISAHKVDRARPPESKKDKVLPKFEDLTTTKEYFRKWDVKPRPHYGDIHEALQYIRSDQYVPQTTKFNGITTTAEQFTAKTAEMREPFVPQQSKLDTSGNFDFNTVYRSEFEGPSMLKRLPKQEAMLLLKELRRRKNESQKIQKGGLPVCKNPQKVAAK
jgi:hypothetical protein